MNLNFIWTGGPFKYQYYLAIRTAMAVHKVEKVTLFYIRYESSPGLKLLRQLGMECIKVEPRKMIALEGQPEDFRRAHIKDALLWDLGNEFGGGFLDLDTISLKDISDLLVGGEDLVVGMDVSSPSDCEHPYNNAVVIIRPHSAVSAFLKTRAYEILNQPSISWGDTGPKLLSETFRTFPHLCRAAGFRVLGGFGGHERALVYRSSQPIPDPARILHGFAAASKDMFDQITPDWIRQSSSPYAVGVRSHLSPISWNVFSVESWLSQRGRHYEPMFQSLSTMSAKNILEIGTYNGENAVGMILTSKAPLEEIHYYGFDLFEPHSDELIEKEISQGYHRPPSLTSVYNHIFSYTGVEVSLHQGDSKLTVPAADLPIMDFIYIDGGHSIETIRADWHNIQKCIGPETVVYFDDVFLNRTDIGALFIVSEIDETSFWVERQGEPDSYALYAAQLLRVQPRHFKLDEAPSRPRLRLHLLGLAHIPTSPEVSMCAYTQKVVKLSRMMTDLGHEVILYGGEDSNAQCSEFVECISAKERSQCYGEYDWRKEFFRHSGTDLAYSIFNLRATHEISRRKSPGDLLLVTMGNYQKPIADHSEIRVIESGIGYEGVFSSHRVFESYAWMHHVYGLLQERNGSSYDAVIPNYFYPEDFPFQPEKSDYLLFIGRLVRRKGVEIAVEVAKRLDKKLIIAGQGSLVNPAEGLNITDTHVEFVGSVDPVRRSELMGQAQAVFVPTMYLEPFGGVAVEAQMCGTPVITSDWGAFPETVLHGKTGYRCRTLDDYVWAARNISRIDPWDCREWAESNFGAERVALMYEEYFQKIQTLQSEGWYHINPQRTDLDWLNRNYLGA